MFQQLKNDYEKNTGATVYDSLTGLFNHGFFSVLLELEIKRSKRYGKTITIALIDIDSFSQCNQRLSPIAGDRILKEIAGCITANIRQIDLASRYVGDVLAVIFIESNTQEALVPVERIRRAVEEKYDGVPTISVGLSSYPDDGGDGPGLIAKAKEALSQAKISGKNKVQFFQKESPSDICSSPTILVVDDEPLNVTLLEANLLPLNYKVIKAYNGKDALGLLSKTDVDLILLDVMMPVMDGYEVCRRVKGSEATRLIPIIMVTALDDIEAKIAGIEAGVDDFLTKPPNKVELLARTRSLINIKRLNDNLTSIESVLFSLAKTVEAKDKYTQGHVERVANLALTLGRKIRLSTREIEALKYGGMLHDIGKIGVPREILNKPGPLEPEEWEIMKNHPDIGHKICQPLKRVLGSALEVIRSHHEKLDGSGYPDGLRGDEISKAARIMAVVDIYDALTSDRPYRKAMTAEKALDILRDEASKDKLDKEVVGCLSELVH